MYLRLADLVSIADDITGPAALAIYAFDIGQVAFNLYILFYSASSLQEQVVDVFWVATSVASLIVISLSAASVERKVGLSGKYLLQDCSRLQLELQKPYRPTNMAWRKIFAKQ